MGLLAGGDSRTGRRRINCCCTVLHDGQMGCPFLRRERRLLLFSWRKLVSVTVIGLFHTNPIPLLFSAVPSLGLTRFFCFFGQIEPRPRRKRDGHGYRLLIGPLCNGDSQQLMPGGVAILFAWGHPSTNILKKG